MASFRRSPLYGRWLCWPKARLKPGFNEHAVRGAGLVDYKVCSIDEDWSALKFARRKA